jgi:hypothetical protein
MTPIYNVTATPLSARGTPHAYTLVYILRPIHSLLVLLFRSLFFLHFTLASDINSSTASISFYTPSSGDSTPISSHLDEWVSITTVCSILGVRICPELTSLAVTANGHSRPVIVFSSFTISTSSFTPMKAAPPFESELYASIRAPSTLSTQCSTLAKRPHSLYTAHNTRRQPYPQTYRLHPVQQCNCNLT